MTNPQFFSDCMHDVIQLGQICAACCKNKYTYVLLIRIPEYQFTHASNQGKLNILFLIIFQDFHARLSNDLVELSHLKQTNRKTGHPLPPLPGEGARPKSAVVLESSLSKKDVVRLRNKDQPEHPKSFAKPSPKSCTSTPLPGMKFTWKNVICKYKQM